MAAIILGSREVILPQKRRWLQVTHLTFGTLLLHLDCASMIASSWAGDLQNSTCHECLSSVSGLSSAVPQALLEEAGAGFVGDVLLFESGSSVLGASP